MSDSDLLRQMMTIREFENRVMELFSSGLVRGTTHLANGQEAVAVGAASALEGRDLVLSTYRGHHHNLARGMPLADAFAEILGRSTGCCGGKGGSMHLTDVSRGLMGSYAIVGAHLPIAVGCAWASTIRGEDVVTCCFFGDGTTTIGAFHEAVNMAAVWKLPVIFVCENNHYSEYTAISAVVPVDHPAADRAGAYGLERIVVDGNDVRAVADVVRRAREQCAAGNGPVMIEADTYRQGGHSRADPATYRPTEEVDRWLARDPIEAFAGTIGLTGTAFADLRRHVLDDIERAVTEALSAPEPSLEALTSNVWAGQ